MPDTTPVRKLLVDLNKRTDDELTDCANREGINKTTVVNRAVQVYAAITDNQAAGGSLVLIRPDGSIERFVIT